MSHNTLSDCGATDEEVVESLQEEFDNMQRAARAFAARCRDLEEVLRTYSHETRLQSFADRERFRKVCANLLTQADGKAESLQTDG
jgi:hypothetical protein